MNFHLDRLIAELNKLFNTYDKMKWEDIYFANLKTNHVSFSYCQNKYLPSV